MAREPLTSCAVCEVHADAVFRVEGMDCRDEVVLLPKRRPSRSQRRCTWWSKTARLRQCRRQNRQSHPRSHV